MAGDIVLPVHLGHSEEDVAQGAEAIARTFGVSRRTIIRWKNAGAPIYKVGGPGGRKYQCQWDDLWQWIKQNQKRLYEKPKKE